MKQIIISLLLLLLIGLYVVRIENGVVAKWGNYYQYCKSIYLNQDTVSGGDQSIPWVLVSEDDLETLLPDTNCRKAFDDGHCVEVNVIYLDIGLTTSLNNQSFRRVYFISSSDCGRATQIRVCGCPPA